MLSSLVFNGSCDKIDSNNSSSSKINIRDNMITRHNNMIVEIHVVLRKLCNKLTNDIQRNKVRSIDDLFSYKAKADCYISSNIVKTPRSKSCLLTY